MEAKRFDALAKAWITMPRRRLLGGFAAGTLGPLLGHGGGAVSAQVLGCRRSSDCPTGQVCVHKTCAPTCDDPFICVNGSPEGDTGCPTGCFCAKNPGG